LNKRQKRNIRLIVPAVLWVFVMVSLWSIAPDLDILVREHGQHDIPEGYSTQIAQDILEEHEGTSGEEVLVLYEMEEELEAYEDKILTMKDDLIEDPGELEIAEVVTPFDGSQEENLLVGEDGELLLVIIELDMTVSEISFVREEIQDKTEIEGMESYTTGAAIIEDDVLTTTEERLGMIEYLTVALVYIVLLVVFKSPIAPLVPLITLGASYFTSIAIVSLLIEHVGFPVSNFSQVFVLTVTFAIGTDYVILLMKRYQEELTEDEKNGRNHNSEDNHQRVQRTFRFTRGAVLSSAITGFVGFVTIGLADFNLYRSGVGVAVAVVVLILAIWTWVPLFIGVIGQKLFWPSHKSTKKENNRVWGFIGRYSTGYPAWSLLFLIILMIPLLLLFRNERSFHSLDELEGDQESVVAFEKIEEHFGEGEFFYGNLIVEAEDPNWDDAQRISYGEMVTNDLLKIEDVEEVRTITRPEGSPIDAITVPYQAGLITDEVGEALEGVQEIQQGLEEMEEELRSTKDQLAGQEDEVQELVDGTAESRSASGQLQSGANEVNHGVRNMRQGVRSTQDSLEEYYNCLDMIDSLFEKLIGLFSDEEISVLSPVLEPLQEGIEEVRRLQQGLGEASAGLDEISRGAGQLQRGLREIEEGQKALMDSFTDLQEGLEEFHQGVVDLMHGVDELEEGMISLQEAFEEVADQEENVLAGIFIPEDLYEEEFGDAWEAYGTPNRNVVIFQTLLGVNPYGDRAMDVIEDMEDVARFSLQKSDYEDSKVAIEGLPARNRDLRALSRQAFFQTATYMLIGIFVVLTILYKSLIMPIYAMFSLVITYIASQTIVELIFINGLGYPGVMWSVPFFTFVMLMSMGVDYSIFLLTRFNEEMDKKKRRTTGDVKKAMHTAMKKVGGAVFSAAVILGASFAAITLSGIQSLVQIGLWIIIGLGFYVLVLLPIFIPAVASLFGGNNWWPFHLISGKKGAGNPSNLTLNSTAAELKRTGKAREENAKNKRGSRAYLKSKRRKGINPSRRRDKRSLRRLRKSK